MRDDTESRLAARLEHELGLPRVVAFHDVGSTLDEAHALAAAGAPAGTLVLADAQTAGRGRQGRTWRSEAGSGVWLTLIERPQSAAALDVLSLRVGLALAPALDAFAESPVRLKWPNDLYVGERKLAGILIEARWRDAAPEWVAIGVGINLRAPAGEPGAAGLRAGVSRDETLRSVVPAIRAAAACTGHLGSAELEAFASRDLARGRACVEPVHGTVQGIDASGGLVVEVSSDTAPRRDVVRAGSLVLEDTP